MEKEINNTDQQVPQEVAPEIDLVTKVSEYKKPEDTTQAQATEGKFNTNDLQTEIDKIQDPNLKNQMEGLQKSLLRGGNDKFQELAVEKKAFDLRKAELEQKMIESGNWTNAKIEKLLKDQNFITASQSYMQNQPKADEYDQLTGEEKALRDKQFLLEQEINALKQTNMQASNAQLDERLKGKYANYDSNAVSQLKQDLISERIKATNEHLWKVLDYESAIQRAYELGKNDVNGINKDKLASAPYVPSSSNVVKEPQLTDKQPSLAELYKFNKDKTQPIR